MMIMVMMMMMTVMIMSNFTCNTAFLTSDFFYTGRSKKSQNSLKLENDTKAEVQ